MRFPVWVRASTVLLVLGLVGAAPGLSMQVRTEDGRDALLRTDADDAWKGTPGAPVTVVQISDIECGYCRRMFGRITRLAAVYGDVAQFVFKHFPMDPGCNVGVKNLKHTHACAAAAAAVCANEQGRFWEFAGLAFKNQHQLEDPALRLLAEAAKLDLPRFDACLPSAQGHVQRDGLAGANVDVHGTPRVFINGTLFRSGASLEDLARAIEAGAGPALGASRLGRLGEDTPPVPPMPEHPAAMQAVRVSGRTVWIDTFEASIQEGKAETARHTIPSTRVSWYMARDACAAAGKRLCTEEEWVAACQGAPAVDDDGDGQFADDLIEGTAWPYGEDYLEGRCWTDHVSETLGEWRPVYTGEMPGCVGPLGAYDLTGNVEEWVGASPAEAVQLGGAFDTSEDHARCYRRNDTYGPGYQSVRGGFRCCADAPPR